MAAKEDLGHGLAVRPASSVRSAKLAGEPIEFEHRVTNVYRLEDGQWKMVHHHTDTSPGLVEMLQRRQAA